MSITKSFLYLYTIYYQENWTVKHKNLSLFVYLFTYIFIWMIDIDSFIFLVRWCIYLLQPGSTKGRPVRRQKGGTLTFGCLFLCRRCRCTIDLKNIIMQRNIFIIDSVHSGKLFCFFLYRCRAHFYVVVSYLYK